MKCSLDTSSFLEETSSLSHSIVFLYFFFFLHCSLKKAFLSLLAILWTSAFSWVYLFLSPLPFTSLLFLDFHGGFRWRICLQFRRQRFDPWVQKIPWRRKWQYTPVFLLGEFCGQSSLPGYSHEFSKRQTQLNNFHFSLFSQLFVRHAHFGFLHFFFFGMVLVITCCIMLQISVHSSSGTLCTKYDPMNLFITCTV